MLWGREPAIVLAAIQSIIALGISFGLSLTAEQVGTITALTAALLGIIVRQNVMPMKTVFETIDTAVQEEHDTHKAFDSLQGPSEPDDIDRAQGF